MNVNNSCGIEAFQIKSCPAVVQNFADTSYHEN
jgi:hypothetical protein